MSICTSCHKEFFGREYPNQQCQGCYLYFRKGGIVHPLPPAGVIAKTSEGKVICHICGRAYTRLGSHVKESHSMSIEEYKEEFGLCRNSKTTESKYSETMRKYAYKNDMPKRLLETGKNTRIKKGEKDKRLGKTVRLQEKIDKRQRKFKEEQKNES